VVQTCLFGHRSRYNAQDQSDYCEDERLNYSHMRIERAELPVFELVGGPSHQRGQLLSQQAAAHAAHSVGNIFEDLASEFHGRVRRVRFPIRVDGERLPSSHSPIQLQHRSTRLKDSNSDSTRQRLRYRTRHHAPHDERCRDHR
jgi:hypothetical protein